VSATSRKKRVARQKRFFQDARRRIKKRLDNTPGPEQPLPMMTATNIHYELRVSTIIEDVLIAIIDGPSLP
jgi:hypothetical protein